MPRRFPLRLCLLLIAAALAGAGCAPGPEPKPEKPPEKPEKAPEDPEALEDAGKYGPAAEAWAARAEEAEGAEAARLRYRQANALALAGNDPAARRVLEELRGTAVDRKARLLLARIHLRQNRPEAARPLLEDLTEVRGEATPPDGLREEALDYLAQLHLGQRRPGPAFDALVDRHRLLPEGERQASLARIRYLLGAMPRKVLEDRIQAVGTDFPGGYLRFEQLMREATRQPLSRTKRDLNGWLEQYPDHPLAAIVRNRLKRVQEAPLSIAILLPLDSRYAAVAEALLRGMLTAYYQTDRGAGIRLRVFDTEGTREGARKALAEVRKGEFAAAIGPLTRPGARAVSEREPPAGASTPASPEAGAGDGPASGYRTERSGDGKAGQEDPTAGASGNGEGSGTGTETPAAGDEPEGSTRTITVGESTEADPKLPPTLILNTTRDWARGTDRLFQFGLDPEEEARQVAEFAYQAGHRQAGVLYPDSDWGERMVRAFQTRWRELGGTTLAMQGFDADKADHSPTLKTLLKLDEVTARQRDLEKTLGIDLPEYDTPPRRKDLDFLFLASDTRSARLIKPQLEFFAAGEIPILATSHVHNPGDTRSDRQDMDGIRFLQIPWFLDPLPQHASAAKALRNSYPDLSGDLERIHALGYDAYTLTVGAWRRALLLDEPLAGALSRMQMEGGTGRLTVTAQGRVRRSLQWAEYQSGRIFPLPGMLAPGG